MTNFDAFVTLDPQVLKKGMFVDSDIYAINDNKFILLCSRSKLTDEILANIESFHFNGSGIFVTKDYFKSLLKTYGILPGNSGKTLIQLKYKALRQDNKNLIDDVKRIKIIDITKADLVSQSLYFHVTNSDTTSILNCISEVRLADEYLYTHGLNVGILNALQGKWLNMSERECDTLSKIGILHDIGKLKIPQEILDKPAKLTFEEFELIKKHPVFSHEILLKSGINDPHVLRGVREHHERTNGSGYPDGLVYSDISLFGRITAISDTYDAMVSKRSYKNPLLPFEVLANFAENKFSNLDIQLVNVFLTKLPYELKGKGVTLSNGDKGEIQWLNPKDYRHPLVKVGARIIQTNNDIFCTSIDSNF